MRFLRNGKFNPMKPSICILFILVVNTLIAQNWQNWDITTRGTNPEGIFHADFDQDGDPDLVEASRLDNAIGWYENLGDRKFSSRRTISTSAQQATSVYIGDLDGDGDIDVVSSSRQDNKIAWYSNLGNGVFGQQQVITTQAQYAYSVHAEDMDSDGDIDILSASANDNKIALYLNLGSGTFGPQQILTTNLNTPYDVNVADMDNDGDLDVVTGARLSNQIGWLANLGSGNFSSLQVIASSPDTYNICPVDLDLDGNVDVLSSTFSGTEIRYHRNLGNGLFAPTVTINGSLTNSARGVHAFDFDFDGDVDVVVGANQNTYLLQNLGGTVFAPPTLLAAVNCYELQSCDLDQDGKQDIIGVGGSSMISSLFFNDGNLIFQHKIISGYNYRPVYITTTDMDCDGDEDILTASRDDNKLAWHENRGNGDFTCQNTISTSLIQPHIINYADLDNDGDIDILSGSYVSGNVVWFENLGNDQFGPVQIISTITNGTVGVTAVDLDGDGWKDIVSTSKYDNKIAWYKNIGGTGFGIQQIISTSLLNPRGICGEDFDKDGDIDLAIIADSGNDYLVWFQNSGSGTFGSIQVLPSISSGVNLDICPKDFDNDGDIDLIAGNSLYPNIAPGQFGPVQSLLGLGSQYHYFRDINMDGHEDLVGSGSNSIGWWKRFSDGSFDIFQQITALQTGECTAVTDLDNDGDGDILSVELIPNQTRWYENHFYETSLAKGCVYVDVNQNDVFDAGDFPACGITINSLPNPSNTNVLTNGSFQFNVNGVSGLHTIIPILSTNWGISTDSLSYHVIVDSTNQTYTGLNFGISPQNTIDSISAVLSLSPVSCGQDNYAWITVNNLGTTQPSGIIKLTLDQDQTFVNSIPAPDSIVGQEIYWNFTSLGYFQDTIIQLTTQTFATNGDTLSYNLNSSVFNGQVSVFTSIYSIEQVVNCALANNSKMATPHGIGVAGLINDSTDYLDYTINFQNTATYAINEVTIIEQLDPGFDYSTVQLLAMSHPFSADQYQNGKLIFKSTSCLIPSSSVSDVNSRGFLSFRIWLNDSLPNGYILKNKATIKLDCSSFQTNETIHTFYSCSNLLTPFISNQTVCEGSNVFDSIPTTSLLSTINWQISGIMTSSGNNFSWLADTIGTFSLQVSLSNELCSLDTFAIINVNAASPTTILPLLTICSGDTVIVFGDNIHQTGSYSTSLININGCDSIVVQEVFVYPQLDVQIIDTFITCPSTAINIFGTPVISPLLYYDTLQTLYGCDSIIAIQLLNYPIVDPVLNAFQDDTMCVYETLISLPPASPSGGVYSGNGVTGNLFHPGTSGIGEHIIYYTYSDNNGCVGVDSTFITIDGCVGVFENTNPFDIILYPNPYSNSTKITITNAQIGAYDLLIYDHLGRIQYEALNLSSSIFDLNSEITGKGIFLLAIRQISTGTIVFLHEIYVL